MFTLYLHCSYTVLTLFLHCSYTVLTLFLHCSYTVLTLFLHCSYTVLPLFLRCSYAVLTLFLHCSYSVLILTLFLHCSYTVLTLSLQSCYLYCLFSHHISTVFALFFHCSHSVVADLPRTVGFLLRLFILESVTLAEVRVIDAGFVHRLLQLPRMLKITLTSCGSVGELDDLSIISITLHHCHEIVENKRLRMLACLTGRGSSSQKSGREVIQCEH
jgi:hypothetical protein